MGDSRLPEDLTWPLSPCPETYVLMSAFQLAEKEHQLCDFSTQVTYSIDPVLIVKDAIDEIVKGLQTDNSESEARYWKMHLSGILTCLLLKDDLDFSATEEMNNLSLKLEDFPKVNVEFFGQIVCHNMLFDSLKDILLSFDESVTVKVLFLLTLDCSRLPLKLALMLLSFCVTPLNGFLLILLKSTADSTNDHSFLIEPLLHLLGTLVGHLFGCNHDIQNECLSACQADMSQLAQTSFLFLADAMIGLANIVGLVQFNTAVICEKIPVLCDTRFPGVNITEVLNKGHLYGLSGPLLQSLLHQELLKVIKSASSISQLTKEQTCLSYRSNSLGTFLVKQQFRSFFNGVTTSGVYIDAIEHCLKLPFDDACIWDIHTNTWAHSYVLALISHILSMEIIKLQLTQVNPNVATFQSVVQTLPQSQDLLEAKPPVLDDALMLRVAFFHINEKLPSAIDSLSWLLSNVRLCTSEDWMRAVEAAGSYIVKTELLQHMLDALGFLVQRMQMYPGDNTLSSSHSRLKAVFILKYSEFPLSDANTVMSYLFCKVSVSPLDMFQTQDLSTDVTVQMNQLTEEMSSGVEFHRYVKRMMELALMDPRLVIEAFVRNATNNSKQSQLLAKVLSFMPAIFDFESPVIDECEGKDPIPVVFDCVKQYFTELASKSDKCCQNILTFVKGLLNVKLIRIHRPNNYNNLDQSNPCIVLKHIAIPMLYEAFGNIEVDSYCLSPESIPNGKLALLFLENILRTLDTEQMHHVRLCDLVQIPLFYKLCELHSVFSCKMSITDWAYVKELLLACLSLVERVLLRNTEFLHKKHVSWLYGKLFGLQQWQTIVAVHTFLHRTAPMVVTDESLQLCQLCAAFSLCISPSGLYIDMEQSDLSVWSTKDYSSLLCVASISHHLARTILNCVNMDGINIAHLFECLDTGILKAVSRTYGQSWLLLCKFLATFMEKVYDTLDTKVIQEVSPLAAQTFFNHLTLFWPSDIKPSPNTVTVGEFGAGRLGKLLAVKLCACSVHMLHHISNGKQTMDKMEISKHLLVIGDLLCENNPQEVVPLDETVVLLEAAFAIDIIGTMLRTISSLGSDVQETLLPTLLSIINQQKHQVKQRLQLSAGCVLLRPIDSLLLDLTTNVRTALRKAFLEI